MVSFRRFGAIASVFLLALVLFPDHRCADGYAAWSIRFRPPSSVTLSPG